MYKHFIKRFLDIICALLALTVFSPLFIILMIVGAIEMKGNPFFTQPRPGYHEKIFNLIKFRTMSNEKDVNGELLPDEVRLNKYGRFLRSTSLDEIPEAFNILIGDMSVIGPRPQLVRDMVFMSKEQRERHNVRPGLSGLAQISGRNEISWESKLRIDLEYLQAITFKNDIYIVIQTVWKFIMREGINQEYMDTAEDYGDYLLRNGYINKSEYEERIKESERLLQGEKYE